MNLDRTFRAERGRLLRYTQSKVSSREDAEDILQDVFCHLLERGNIAEPVEDWAAWLFTAVRNRVTDWYRKKRLPATSMVSSDEDEGEGLANILHELNNSPEHELYRQMIVDELAEALEELPPEQREAFVLHEIEGCSFNEMSEATGVPVNTLLSRKRYAVSFLRFRLKEIYEIINEMN